MKNLMIISLMILILFVQCHSQYQYFPDEYDYTESNELIRITMKDSTVLFYDKERVLFQLVEDSLFVTYTTYIPNSQNSYKPPDTLNISEISAFSVSEIDPGLTLFTLLGSGLVMILLLGALTFSLTGF